MTVAEALKVVLRDESAGDWVYDVRSRAGESADGFNGNSWEHPRVTRYSEAITTLENELARLERTVPTITGPEHRCGVRGFADSGDTCPGCAARS